MPKARRHRGGASMAKKNPFEFSVPIHLVGYHYQDIPGECHLVCVETGAFGWGPTPAVALLELVKSINGQIEMAIGCGQIDMLPFSKPDEEWLEAYKTNKHPAFDDIKIAFRGLGHLLILLGSPRPSVSFNERIDLVSNIKEEAFQLA